MARDLPGLGSSEIAPLPHRDFDFSKVKLGQPEYFVLSRVDGKTRYGQIIAISGVPEDQAIVILRHLRQVGAIYNPGDDPKRPPVPELGHFVEPVVNVVIDEKKLAEKVDLSEETKRAILMKHGSLEGSSLFAVLGVPRDADKKVLRQARDRITKEFHPDRPLFFKKELGSYRQLLADITEAAVKAYDILNDEAQREAYLVELGQARTAAGSSPPTVAAAQPTATDTPAGKKKRAHELFNAAQVHEAGGETQRALSEFKEAIGHDPANSRILKRAIAAFLKAQSLRDAEEYGKKLAELAPPDAEHCRLYSRVLHRLGKKREARAALEKAVKLDPGNPHIAAELRALIEGENG